MSTVAAGVQDKISIARCLDVLKKQNIPYNVVGDTECEITGYSSIREYKPGSVAWIRSADIVIPSSDIRVIITPRDIEKRKNFVTQIKTDDPQDAFFTILGAFWGEQHEPEIHPTAIIEGARIGKNVSIGAHSVISADTLIGDNCRIGTNVSIKGRVSIGNDCIIQSGVVIGEDGFAFISRKPIKRVPHFGGVTVGDNVRISANCCIFRGTLADTVIDNNVSIDALCHIAHNSKIHTNTIIIPLTVIMGSVEIGSDCWISSSIIRDRISVGNNATVGMGAVVVKDVPDDVVVIGNPAKIMN